MPTTSLNLDQIQGNSISGSNKDFQTNLFLKFTNAARRSRLDQRDQRRG